MILNEIAEELRNGQVIKVKELTQSALDQGKSVKEILNEGLLKGMNKVGVLFKNGEMFVPEVLMASKAMNTSMDLLKPLLKEGDIESKGVCVFATVKGDLHDIGKNLVKMMLENAGYVVIDLGMNVSPEKIVEAAKENNADIVGMSAMLTTTMMAMKETIEKLNEEGLENVKVIVGGAPITDKFAKEIGGNYSPDATSAVDLVNMLTSH